MGGKLVDDKFNFPKKPWQFPALDVAKFKFAFAHVSAAAALKAPVENPENIEFGWLEEDTGDVTTYRLSDNPMNRLMIALKDHFEPGPEYMSAAMRFNAFGELYQDGALDDYIRDDPGDPDAMEVHEAVLEVTATFPFNADLEFDRESLLKAIQRRAAEIDENEIGTD